jgi:hypothetical protein
MGRKAGVAPADGMVCTPKALWLALVFNFDLLTQGSQGHDPSLETPKLLRVFDDLSRPNSSGEII